MSLFDWNIAKDIGRDDPPFASLIMAAYMKADSINTAKIQAAWPDIAQEAQARYGAPGGRLDGEVRHY